MTDRDVEKLLELLDRIATALEDIAIETCNMARALES